MTHGMLFIAYIFSAIYLKIEEKWNALKTTQIVLASVIPFGTFYIEKKYF
jgi:integral membrane protein